MKKRNSYIKDTKEVKDFTEEDIYSFVESVQRLKNGTVGDRIYLKVALYICSCKFKFSIFKLYFLPFIKCFFIHPIRTLIYFHIVLKENSIVSKFKHSDEIMRIMLNINNYVLRFSYKRKDFRKEKIKQNNKKIEEQIKNKIYFKNSLLHYKIFKKISENLTKLNNNN